MTRLLGYVCTVRRVRVLGVHRARDLPPVPRTDHCAADHSQRGWLVHIAVIDGRPWLILPREAAAHAVLHRVPGRVDCTSAWLIAVRTEKVTPASETREAMPGLRARPAPDATRGLRPSLGALEPGETGRVVGGEEVRLTDVAPNHARRAVCNMRVIHRAWWGPSRRSRSGGMWASRRLVQVLREQGAISPLGLRSRDLGITSQARLAERRAQLGGTIR